MRIIHIIVLSALIGLLMSSCGDSLPNEEQEKRQRAYDACDTFFQDISMPTGQPAYCSTGGYCFEIQGGSTTEVDASVCEEVFKRVEK